MSPNCSKSVRASSRELSISTFWSLVTYKGIRYAVFFPAMYLLLWVGTHFSHPMASESIHFKFQHLLWTSGTRVPSSTSTLSSAVPFTSKIPLHDSTCVGKQLIIARKFPSLGWRNTATILQIKEEPCQSVQVQLTKKKIWSCTQHLTEENFHSHWKRDQHTISEILSLAAISSRSR